MNVSSINVNSDYYGRFDRIFISNIKSSPTVKFSIIFILFCSPEKGDHKGMLDLFLDAYFFVGRFKDFASFFIKNYSYF